MTVATLLGAALPDDEVKRKAVESGLSAFLGAVAGRLGRCRTRADALADVIPHLAYAVATTTAPLHR